jgi:hypothetical protein
MNRPTGAPQRFTPLDIDPDHLPLREQDFNPFPERREFLSNGAGLTRNAADGLFRKPSFLAAEEGSGEKSRPLIPSLFR